MEHLGQQHMLKLIKGNYWWLRIKSNVKKYIQEYTKCQQNKVQYIKKVEELYLLEILEGPWQEISIIGPLPRSKDKNAIVVIVE